MSILFSSKVIPYSPVKFHDGWGVSSAGAFADVEKATRLDGFEGPSFGLSTSDFFRFKTLVDFESRGLGAAFVEAFLEAFVDVVLAAVDGPTVAFAFADRVVLGIVARCEVVIRI